MLLSWLGGEEQKLVLSDALLDIATRAGVLHLLAKDRGMRKNLGAYLDEYLATAALGALKLENLREISRAMEQADLEIMPIKGMAYALMYGSGGPVRPMADIDILVRERDYGRAIKIMKGLGYEDKFYSPVSHAPTHNERAMSRDGQLVEIHRAFVVPGRIAVDYDGLFERSRPLVSEGVRCRVLSAEDGFLYHCFHAALHEFAVGGLRTMTELLDLLENHPPDMEVAAKRARQWGTLRMTWSAMRIASLCFPGRIDSGAVSMFAPCPAVRTMLEHVVIRPSLGLMMEPAKLPRPIQLARKALLMDRWYLAPAYFARYILTSRAQ